MLLKEPCWRISRVLGARESWHIRRVVQHQAQVKEPEQEGNEEGDPRTAEAGRSNKQTRQGADGGHLW